jgi:hypothetical protein
MCFRGSDMLSQSVDMVGYCASNFADSAYAGKLNRPTCHWDSVMAEQSEVSGLRDPSLRSG